MTLRLRKRFLWATAAVLAGVSAVIWLQIGLNQISKPWEGTAAIVAVPIVIENQPDHPAAPEGSHKAVEESAADSSADSIRTALRKGELQEWELRRAFGIGIPDLGIRAPVLLPSRTHWDSQHWNLLEEQMQVGMLYGTVAYPHSLRPGAGGSLFIAGHSSPPSERAQESAYGAVFASLPEIEAGMQIVLTDGDERFSYVVTETFIVNASDTGILEPEKGDTLTLITCYPVGTTRQRYVVKAKRSLYF